MSKFKGKSGTPEVHFARSKLDGVLQTLVEKKDDSPGMDDPDIKDEPEDYDTTPKKGGKGGGRKRKRGQHEAAPEMGQYHHTYVMKLFDRSVDLAQFDENSSLYPICRAWMRNQPHNRNLGPRDRSPTPEPRPDSDEEEDEELKDVYKLPAPIMLKTETDLDMFLSGHETQPADLRIPSPVQSTEAHLDVNADPNLAPPPEQLLLNHMQHWKVVRQRWKDAARRNEARWVESITILKDMFDRQNKDTG